MKRKGLQFEADREMNRSYEIAKLQKKLAQIEKEITETELAMKGKGMTQEWDKLLVKHHNLMSDTQLIERKLQNLRAGNQALGYADENGVNGRITGKVRI